MSLWLIGSGVMAQDYARVLLGIGAKFEVIGRGSISAAAFTEATGCIVKTGGLTNALKKNEAPDQAIIAVGIEQLSASTAELIRAGVKRILVEKPGGVALAEIQQMARIAIDHDSLVFIAYNRRFYSCVQQVRDYILEDGGVLSAQFEFTEWSHRIAPLEKGKGVKEHWVLGNSTHVIDLVFHLIGRPVDWKCWHKGSIEWHPSAARFAGAGITELGVMFSYSADWEAPGRWGIELMTPKRRLILRPMEQLRITQLGCIEVEEVKPPDTLDQDYKPGLYRQTKAFLRGDDPLLCKLSEQVENVRSYSEMAGYVC